MYILYIYIYVWCTRRNGVAVSTVFAFDRQIDTTIDRWIVDSEVAMVSQTVAFPKGYIWSQLAVSPKTRFLSGQNCIEKWYMTLATGLWSRGFWIFGPQWDVGEFAIVQLVGTQTDQQFGVLPNSFPFWLDNIAIGNGPFILDIARWFLDISWFLTHWQLPKASIMSLCP